MSDQGQRFFQDGKWIVIPPKNIREQILHEDIIRNSANGERDHKAFLRSIKLENDAEILEMEKEINELMLKLKTKRKAA